MAWPPSSRCCILAAFCLLQSRMANCQTAVLMPYSVNGSVTAALGWHSNADYRNAFDGDITTWAQQHGRGIMTIEADLGSPAVLGLVRVHPRTSNTSMYGARLEGRLANTDQWQTLHIFYSDPNPVRWVEVPVSGTYRYVRYYVDASVYEYACLAEIEVYGGLQVTTTTTSDTATTNASSATSTNATTSTTINTSTSPSTSNKTTNPMSTTTNFYTTTTIGRLTTTINSTTTQVIQGSFGCTATGATSAQVVAGAVIALADEFEVAQPQVQASATPLHLPEGLRRLTEDFLVQYLVTIAQSQAVVAQTKLVTISSNSTAFSSSLVAALINEGVRAAALANFQVTNFAGSLAITATTTTQASTTSTTKTTSTSTITTTTSKTSTTRISAMYVDDTAASVQVSTQATAKAEDNTVLLVGIICGSATVLICLCCCIVMCTIWMWLNKVSKHRTSNQVGAVVSSQSANQVYEVSSTPRGRLSISASILDQRGLLHPLPRHKTYHYFLSHKKHHSVFGNVSELVCMFLQEHLGARGWRGFFDVDCLKEITQEQLKSDVRSSCVMIVVLSDETDQSEWCRMEWNEAQAEDIPIVCVVDLKRFEQVKILEKIAQTNDYLLKFQWVDYTDQLRKIAAEGLEDFLVAAMEGNVESFYSESLKDRAKSCFSAHWNFSASLDKSEDFPQANMISDVDSVLVEPRAVRAMSRASSLPIEEFDARAALRKVNQQLTDDDGQPTHNDGRPTDEEGQPKFELSGPPMEDDRVFVHASNEAALLSDASQARSNAIEAITLATGERAGPPPIYAHNGAHEVRTFLSL